MKKKWLWIYAILAVAVIVGALFALGLLEFPEANQEEQTTPATTTPTTTTTTTAPVEDVVTSDHLSFTGKVLELDGDSVLMECYDKDKFDTVWVNISQTGVAPKAGEEYTVIYEDMVMPSLPPRITAVRMTTVFSTPSTTTTSKDATPIANRTSKKTEIVLPTGYRCPEDKHDLVEVDMPATCLRYRYKIINCQRCSYYYAEKIGDELGAHTFETESDTCSVCKKQFVDQYLKNWLLKGNGKTYPGIEGLAYDMGENPKSYDDSTGRFYLVYDKEEDLLYVSTTGVIADKNIDYRLYLKDEKTIIAYCVIEGGLRCQGEYRYVGNDGIQLMNPDCEYTGIEAERDKKNAKIWLGSFLHDVRDQMIELFKAKGMSVKFSDFDFYKEK